MITSRGKLVEDLRTIIDYALAPIMAFGAFLVKKHIKRIDDLDLEMRVVKTDVQVLKSKLDDMKDDIKEIKEGVTKLISKP
jgi:hypothetical protein